MTTIIAREDKGKVTFAYDSLVSGGDSFEMEREKVFVNNGIIFGVAGRLLLNTEFQHYDFPTPPKDPRLTDKYVSKVLLPHIRKLLNDVAPRRHEDEYAMQILAVINNRIYDIGVDTAWVRRVDGIYAIGSGGDFARGAIDSGADLEAAIQVAAKNDPGTGGRLTIITAENLLKREASR